ncbi:unnamed protein product [Brassica napus]|uniref:(rape) hypothetical protein n=1 Tax=Brassica napus TaxID=3708 RepID=A0A816Y8D7_BRANA|nr:unnamed protein product [Brassica napus]
MAFTLYSCKECGSDLNLNPNDLFPPDFYFEAGNKATISFAAVDADKFRFEKEDKIMPFFETLNYWGIQRKRTKIKCHSCGHLVGYIYDDGPPLTGGIGQYGFGPSQDEDYKRFEESLDMEDPETEVHEGIKDWWMKSKYAYLNQPALGSADSLKRKRFSSYVPNYFSFKPCIPLYATSLNVF